jgi:hypothetical protein
LRKLCSSRANPVRERIGILGKEVKEEIKKGK